MDTRLQLIEGIKEGAGTMLGILTGATCGAACWHAMEEICRCSCGGENHGCLNREGGHQPERKSRIQGDMYTLAGVGYEGIDAEAQAINKEAGIPYVYIHRSRNPMDGRIPARVRPATESQVKNWPELSAYRCNLPEVWKANNPGLAGVKWPGLPMLLWKMDQKGGV